MYKIIFDDRAKKQLFALDVKVRLRIEEGIDNKLLKNPDIYLIPLVGDKIGVYKFRVGNYRLLCKKDGDKLVITVLKVSHRKEVYR
jgi:mRNA interferase RelE/StbE